MHSNASYSRVGFLLFWQNDTVCVHLDPNNIPSVIDSNESRYFATSRTVFVYNISAE